MNQWACLFLCSLRSSKRDYLLAFPLLWVPKDFLAIFRAFLLSFIPPVLSNYKILFSYEDCPQTSEITCLTTLILFPKTAFLLDCLTCLACFYVLLTGVVTWPLLGPMAMFLWTTFTIKNIMINYYLLFYCIDLLLRNKLN
jgi:hypothetical protein